MDKQQAITELKKANPAYAQVLSGLNPPQTSRDSPGKLIKIKIVLWVAIGFSLSLAIFLMFLTHFFFTIAFIQVIALLLIYYFGNKFSEHLVPPFYTAPLLMYPNTAEFPRSDDLVILTYQLPFAPEPLHEFLKLELDRILHFSPSSDADTLEYLVAPTFAQAVYEAKIPVFRYSIQVRPVATSTSPTAPELWT